MTRWSGYGVQSIDRYIQERGQVGICPSRLFQSQAAALEFNGPLKPYQVLVKVTVEPAGISLQQPKDGARDEPED